MVKMHTVVTIWMTWHVVITVDVAMGDGVWVVVLGDVATLGCCALSRVVTWQSASGMAVGGHW